jgi:hypothetical protein
MHHRRRTSILLSAAACALAWRTAHGATSGTWTGNTGIWTASNAWTSSPAYPDGGGTASFGNVAYNYNVIANTNVTINQMVIDSPLPYTFSGSITLTGPAEIDVEESAPESPQVFSTGVQIDNGINGTAGLVKSGLRIRQ